MGNLYATDFDDPLTGQSIIDRIINGVVTTYATTSGTFERLALAPDEGGSKIANIDSTRAIRCFNGLIPL